MKKLNNYIEEKLIIGDNIYSYNKQDIIKEVKELLKNNEYEDISDDTNKKENLDAYKLYGNEYYIADLNDSYNNIYGTTFIINSYNEKYILNFHKFTDNIIFGFMKRGSRTLYTIISRNILGWENIKKKIIKELKLKNN